jgi:golgi phosphoprotein 3
MSNLYEEMYLLTIHEDKGTILSAAQSNLPFGLAGALLTELALRGKLQVNPRHRVEVVDASQTGDDILDEISQEISKSEQPRKIGYWINKLSDDHKKISKRLVERLVMEGIVVVEDKRMLWAIPCPGSPEPCGSAKYWLKARLRKLALADQEANLQDLALLNLAQSLHWFELIFTQDERKLAARNLHGMLLNLAMSNPTAQTIEEIGAAIESVAEGD